jgi:uncharacterized alkaline shock family protein YloU
MTSAESTQYGRITISPNAIATIASRAASQSYGIVGMASRNLMKELAHSLAHDPRHGVEVRYIRNSIMIDLYIVVEYGTRISTVAASAANSVKYQVEKAIGLPVDAVNVHIQDLRVSDRD